MKVSTVKAVVTQEDIIEVVDEYIKIEGLKINYIHIDELITIKGTYKKGVEFPFKAVIGLGNIHENIINIKLFNVSVAKLTVISRIKKLVLKNLLKEFKENGFRVNGDVVEIDLNLIAAVVPHLNFKLKTINLLKEAVEVEIEDAAYAPNKEIVKHDRKKEDTVKQVITDGYSKVRESVQAKVPDKCKNLIEYAMIVPDIAALLWRLFKDNRIKFETKIMIGGAIAFLASPIDIIPGFIPFIGQIDDVAVAFFVMNKIINDVPREVILENWNGKEDIILKVQEGVYYISNLVGSKNIAKLVEFIRILGKKKETKEQEIYEKGNDIH